MNSISNTENILVRLVVNAVGMALFIAALFLLNLGVADILGSGSKFVGALIFYLGCCELAQSGWRSCRQWRSRRSIRAS
jgi:hypothetical protein